MKKLNQLDKNMNYWFEKSMNWMDALWDDDMSLCISPTDRSKEGTIPKHHTIRNSIWYATGLLIRQADGDVDRAQQAIEAIMTYQFDEPDTVYHGTFYRAPQESHPPENPTEWRDYDPNWREFICSVFIILIKEFGDLLPASLSKKMHHSIWLASEGAYTRKVPAEYTNISLMSAFLLDYAGIHFDQPQWQDYALKQAHTIKNLFAENKTFHEYNSPTYYGVDLYALALWRKYGSTSAYQSMGADMEAELWRDIAQFYNADMYNLCGPYDRSYGMDMRDYIAVVGLWIAAVLPPNSAPLPNVDEPFNHAGDFYFVPLVALVDSIPPDDVMPHLQAFQQERYLERTIEPNRTATAWLSKNLMMGAEADDVNIARSDQFHPATAHWIVSNGSIGWLRTRSASLIKAVVKPREITLWGTPNETTHYVFEICAAGATTQMIDTHRWTLPGATINIGGTFKLVSTKQEDTSIIVQLASDEGITLTFEHA